MRYAITLAVVLCVLFWKSFVPDFVHFSNDGPLGQQMSAYHQPHNLWVGTWSDQGYIGGNAGSLMTGSDGLFYFPSIALKFYIAWVFAWWLMRKIKSRSPKAMAFMLVQSIWCAAAFVAFMIYGFDNAPDWAFSFLGYFAPLFAISIILTPTSDKYEPILPTKENIEAELKRRMA